MCDFQNKTTVLPFLWEWLSNENSLSENAQILPISIRLAKEQILKILSKFAEGWVLIYPDMFKFDREWPINDSPNHFYLVKYWFKFVYFITLINLGFLVLSFAIKLPLCYVLTLI